MRVALENVKVLLIVLEDLVYLKTKKNSFIAVFLVGSEGRNVD